MKDISSLSGDLDKIQKNLVSVLMEAQQKTANEIKEDLKQNANKDTGDFVNSIFVEETKNNGNHITTFIGSTKSVTSKNGNSFNLGFLLENGTSPHAIPNAFGFGEEFGTQPDFHPRNTAIQ